MKYREIGKTGRMAGVIGLGMEHLDGKPYEQVKDCIDVGIENGVNLMDIFMPGKQIRENIAKALGSKRKDVMIQGHFGSTDLNQQYDISRDLTTVQRFFEEYLRLFGYVDFGMMFFVDSEDDYKKIFETDYVAYVQKLKQQGDIRHIGFSSHNPIIAKRVVETGVPEMMMFSINAAFDMSPADASAISLLVDGFDTSAFHGVDPVRTALYQLCEQRGVGITVMKTFGAGKLLSPEHTPFEKPMTATQCIHYALTRPSVASVMLGCKNRAEVLEAMTYFDKSDAELDYSHVLGTQKNDFKGNCVYCSHCQPCPSRIDIAAVNKYLDIARLDEKNVSPSIRSHYAGLLAAGGDCIACGSCESRCPFAVPIIDNMAAAAAVFGK